MYDCPSQFGSRNALRQVREELIEEAHDIRTSIFFGGLRLGVAQPQRISAPGLVDTSHDVNSHECGKPSRHTSPARPLVAVPVFSLRTRQPRGEAGATNT